MFMGLSDKLGSPFLGLIRAGLAMELPSQVKRMHARLKPSNSNRNPASTIHIIARSIFEDTLLSSRNILLSHKAFGTTPTPNPTLSLSLSISFHLI